ncbi:MAG: phosphohistidine phosphatase SixA [Solirubrobacterales bacterium]|nr:phosphohistidine phosphatase SixA [Solirubrobacterales bacterium]
MASILQAPSSSEYSLWTCRWTAPALTLRSCQAGQMPRRRDPATCDDRGVIWLLRHGEAEGSADDDASRRLTATGGSQSRAAGAALAALGVQLDACLTSPKLRALDTARIACEVLGLDPEPTAALRGGDFVPAELVAGRGEVVLVGHEPDLSRAIQVATGARVALKKGGLAAIDESTLMALLRPDHLRGIAGS